MRRLTQMVVLLVLLILVPATATGAETPRPPRPEVASLLVGGLHFYQNFISSQDRPTCNFHPSCSHFAVDAIEKAGAAKGLVLSADRLLRCHPLARMMGYPIAPDGRCEDPVEVYLASAGGAPDPGGSPPSVSSPTTNVATPPVPVGLHAPQETLGFGRFLFSRGDYARAATEFERAAWSAGAPDDTTFYMAAVALRLSGRPDRSRSYLQHLLDESPPAPLGRAAMWQLTYSYLASGDHEAGIAALGDLRAGRPGTERDEGGLLAAVLAFDGLWLESTGTAASTCPGPHAEALSCELTRIGEARLARGTKSPLKAALLSAIVPGAGRVYAGRATDGLISLLSIGFLAWQSADGFHEDGASSVKGWMAGAVGLYLYSGNVAGSALSATIVNRRADERARMDVVRALETRCPSVLDTELEVRVTFAR